MVKTLADLLDALPDEQVIAVHGEPDVTVSAPVVESDHEMQPGGVFVARQGLAVDGHDFIAGALERGAAAIVGEKARDALDIHLTVPYVQVKKAHMAIGRLAAAYHDYPSRQLIIFGVTGTDGKTTTIHLLHRILKTAYGEKAGFISTIEADFGSRSAATGLHVTTPGAPQVQDYLAQMVAAGVTHVVLEMTSHGLEQGRLSGVDIDVAILTNITHEHLDFHGSWENYRAAKAMMFEMLGQSARKPNTPKVSVLNTDDPSFEFFAAIESDSVLSYGVQNPAANRALDVDYAPGGTHFTVNGERYQLKLVGEFNVLNALAALSAAEVAGIDADTIRAGLLSVDGISGRMERIDEGQDFMALVDFAHTPNALKRALEAGREMLDGNGRLIAVFGSAGLRDIEKRRMMAEVSARLADMTVLTAEDPRTESLDEILQMMAEGCISQGGVEGETFIRVPDRGEAIYQACQMAQAGDLVMACGKGHEQSMCFGVTEYDWDDRGAMRAALRGKPLRTLPTASSGE
jgi:UDP-N-acetylmuramoyl-L-alanyl-D-glutamate--2,6-diaminopimelate ligase